MARNNLPFGRLFLIAALWVSASSRSVRRTFTLIRAEAERSELVGVSVGLDSLLILIPWIVISFVVLFTVGLVQRRR